MLSAYADEHVESAIVEGLRLNGMDVVTVQERDQRQTDDNAPFVFPDCLFFRTAGNIER